MDVKVSFFLTVMYMGNYIEQLSGYVKKNEEDKVYKLKKVLYGLKQAPRALSTKTDT